MAVSGTIKALKNIMRMDAGINGDAQYIEQIVGLLFLKVMDYKEEEWELMEGNDYYQIIPTGYRWRDWAADDEGITGDELIEHVNTMFNVFKDLDITVDTKKRKWLVRDVMAGVNNFMKSGTLLRQVINKINEDVNLDEAQHSHMFNGIYEGMLKDLQSAGKAGEFYTPRPVTNFVVEKVNPQLGETVIDPACGTCGFLTSVISRFGLETAEDYSTLQQTIRGIEKKPFPYLLGVTNLIAHGIDVPNIIYGNTLLTNVNDYAVKDKVDVVVTNPPFGGAEEKALSQSVPANLRNTETADLFLVHIMYMLKDGGRCGLVLPDGFLFGTGVKSAIKKKLVEENNLHTIIRLPNDVFAPYTNINTNLLFFNKGTPTKGIWFYRLEMPEGYKHFSKTKPMLDKHFDPVNEWWGNRQESDIAQYVPVAEIIAADYNLDFCGFPNEETEILPPQEFIAKYRKEKAEISARIEGLLQQITVALEKGDA